MKNGVNAIMIALGKAKPDRSSSDKESDDDMADDESSEDLAPSDEETSAYKEFRDALKSDDDETGAMALKNFIHACMEKGY